jgi:hypothetical protein
MRRRDYDKSDRPQFRLTWKPFDQFFSALDEIIISDVIFAFTGKRPKTERNTRSVTLQKPTKQNETETD